MDRNPIKILESLGQSIWLDYIRRDLITSGQLQRLIDEDGLSGLTSNPSIFKKAIAESNLYDADIQGISITKKNHNVIYESIIQQDIQNAADLFRPLYEKSKGGDGYVSLEVNPHLAYDTLGTIEEGCRLSVASFFLSRIDAEIDPKEEVFVASGGEQAHFATRIRGQVAISIAKIAYKIYRQIFESEEFLKLGASPQRLLWASTSPKNPDYSDLKYVEALIGPNTVSTIPLETLEAYRDHGDPESLLEYNLDEASLVLSELSEAGIDLKEITEKLETDGVDKFIQSYDKLIEVLSKKSRIC